MRGAECACGRTRISLFFLFLVALFLCALVHISGGGCENSPGSFKILLPETWIARANNFYIYKCVHAQAALALCLIIISLSDGEPFSCTQNVNVGGEMRFPAGVTGRMQ
jgi:hypothetical protein